MQKSITIVAAIGLLWSSCVLALQQNTSARNCTDEQFWDKAEELNRKVASGTLMFPNRPDVLGKDLNKIQDLCMYLLDRHNDMPVGEGGTTNSGYLGGVYITTEECLNALRNPSGYDPGDFDRWKGKHDGQWFNDDGRTFDDDATWGKEKNGDRDYGGNGPDSHR